MGSALRVWLRRSLVWADFWLKVEVGWLVGGSRHEHLSSLRVWRLEPPLNLTCEEDIVEPVFQQLPGLLRPTQHHGKAALGGGGGADRSPQTQLSSSGMVQPAWSPPTLLLPDLDNPS